MPFLLQHVTDSVNSAYLSIAIARTVLQVLILVLIAAMVSGTRNPMKMEFLVAALVITPLFQVNGYNHWMGITYNSVTYSFFYSLPLIFLLLYFMPFVNQLLHGEPMGKGFLFHLRLGVLAMVIAFGGPLGAPAALTVVAILFLFTFMKYMRGFGPFRGLRLETDAVRAIAPMLKLHFSLLAALCLYSLYVGTHNAENLWYALPLNERYGRMWPALWDALTEKLGIPVLLGMCMLNIVLVSRLKNEAARRTIWLSKLLGLFALVFILLLPLGGYREYRPNIIRSDTLSPVILSMMIVFGKTSLILFAHFRGYALKTLVAAHIVIAFIYTNADRYERDFNGCQKIYLRQLAESSDPVVTFHYWCNLLSWVRIRNPEDSHVNAELIRYWGITDKARLYYQPD